MTEKTDAAPENGDRSPPADKTPIAPARTSLEEFSELLHGFDGETKDDEAQGDESHEDGKKPTKPKKPKNLDELAEALAVKVDSLYDVEIPSSRSGEKPYTLGGLKDLAKERDDFAVATIKLDADRRAFDRDKVSAETELREMLSSVPADQLKPEAMKKMRDRLEAQRVRARVATLEAIPEWKDPTAREADLKLICEQLDGYGISHAFLTINPDPGVFRFLRDMQRLSAMVTKALEAVEERRGKTPPKSGKRDAKPNGESKRGEHVGHVEGAVRDFRAAINAAASRKH